MKVRGHEYVKPWGGAPRVALLPIYCVDRLRVSAEAFSRYSWGKRADRWVSELLRGSYWPTRVAVQKPHPFLRGGGTSTI